MSRRVLAALAAALAGVLAAVLVAVFGGGSSPVAPPRASIGIATAVAPREALFGQPVVATVDVVLDRRAVRAESLDPRGTYQPYVPAGPATITRSDSGPVSRIRLRIPLKCVETVCLPPDPGRGGQRSVQLPPVELHFVRTDGTAGRLPVAWPSFELLSRLSLAQSLRINAISQPAFQASLALSQPSYRLSPTLLVWLLAGGGGLLLAAAGGLGAVASRPGTLRRLTFRWLRRREPVGLARALLLLERARTEGVEPEQRKALELLARELRRSGDPELAGSARTLAWAEEPPADEATAGLAGAVQQRLAREVNGRAHR